MIKGNKRVQWGDPHLWKPRFYLEPPETSLCGLKFLAQH